MTDYDLEFHYHPENFIDEIPMEEIEREQDRQVDAYLEDLTL